MSYNESSTPIHYILYMDRYIVVAYVNIIFIHLKKLYYMLCYVLCYVLCVMLYFHTVTVLPNIVKSREIPMFKDTNIHVEHDQRLSTILL